MAHRDTDPIKFLACMSINTLDMLREGGKPHETERASFVCMLGIVWMVDNIHLMRGSG